MAGFDRTRAAAAGPGRRDELTFRGNLLAGRHGWLRLTPAYAAAVVERILSGRAGGLAVLDPFSGSGTTALAARAAGLEAFAIEVNPFLVWLGRAKVRRYPKSTLSRAAGRATRVLELAGAGGPASDPPPIRNVERWWSAEALDGLCRLKGSLDRAAGRPGPARDLLLVAFCRTVMALSNAAFDHQSMSFARTSRRAEGGAVAARFAADVEHVLGTAAGELAGTASVLEGDARDPSAVLGGRQVDLVVTSPPYPNRMSYVRELRPYMYWLGYLRAAREAGELDWRAIGGTWGVATSRVARWRESSAPLARLAPLLERIRGSSARSGAVLACYLGRYFEDIRGHVEATVPLVRPGGELHYVVGNTKFYDVTVPVERLYADLLEAAGARSVEVSRLRKRTSKRELYEFDVVARV